MLLLGYLASLVKFITPKYCVSDSKLQWHYFPNLKLRLFLLRHFVTFFLILLCVGVAAVIFSSFCILEALHACVLSCFSRVQLCVTLWTVTARWVSMGFSKQEYWSGLPCPPPKDLPDQGIEPTAPALQVDSLPTKPPGKPHKVVYYLHIIYTSFHILWIISKLLMVPNAM